MGSHAAFQAARHGGGADAHLEKRRRRAARLAGRHPGDADQFGIPEAGLLLILGIDQFLDMGRSATNVIGNSLAAAAVAKFEKSSARQGRGARGRAAAAARLSA